MKSSTIITKLQDLGVMPSFSRPSISNGNPYSESLFRTLKYRPEYLDKPFDSLNEAREWSWKTRNWNPFTEVPLKRYKKRKEPNNKAA